MFEVNPSVGWVSKQLSATRVGSSFSTMKNGTPAHGDSGSSAQVQLRPVCKSVVVEEVPQENGSSDHVARVGTLTILLTTEGVGVAGASVSTRGSDTLEPRFRGSTSGSRGLSGEIQLTQPARNQQHMGVDIRDPAGAAGDSDDEPVIALKIANNLAELNSGRHPKLKLAFDDWEETFNLCEKRRKYKEAQRDAIWNEIYQVIGFYVVFQGVIFTAVAQASMLRCQNWWTSFLLSLLTSLVTAAVVFQKLRGFWALENTIDGEKNTSKQPALLPHKNGADDFAEMSELLSLIGLQLCVQILKKRITDVKLRIGPSGFNFALHARDGPTRRLDKLELSVRLYGSVFGVLFVFSALFLISSWRILCIPGSAA
ncbi:uncharacterized protein [Physcomitrium patens]|uniref:Transmembrane protein n=1 Tax=Physcomitrium patens TaxID=3218 RepID=A0A2K1IRM9_PHYPA|nr:uncharacterized protein LOC112274289 isoform X1 [Physcomitrium patens]XP_024359395.1 uncharacterized protein LOC112274289 isoform X1 [Physcomitrium patens]XP_024359396.1 uncharacterized protein LOC112274289 isoform X1 [Physcomitrium patens]XP_024359399.1 uncharacterized protein LOC112274289 isoform X1 [Physcomitrium patens]XP_024359400.1 uncharacterized protein LOC112274289 isoform X1 [Physcomitrium patens]XP_024359401.1 uncharacterized protein LOC112274289 isoform X1 [Physcomitrium patens]|eukprot:XP_024359394.1 uncharacterized protein LOC112274289 isoform X1 [Physcomitrella patens]